MRKDLFISGLRESYTAVIISCKMTVDDETTDRPMSSEYVAADRVVQYESIVDTILAHLHLQLGFISVLFYALVGAICNSFKPTVLKDVKNQVALVSQSVHVILNDY